jgi:hypothetical protein
VFLHSHGGANGPYLGSGLNLDPSQELLGEGVSLIVDTTTLVAGGGASARPEIQSTANGITLNDDNTIRGLNVGTTSGTGITGQFFNTLTVSDVGIYGSGRALYLNDGSVNASFDTFSTTGSSDHGVWLANVGGTFTTTDASSSLESCAGETFRLDNCSANVSYAGSIDNTLQESVWITGQTAGTVTFGGDIDDTGGEGLLISNNTGGSFTFNGTVTMTDTTSSALYLGSCPSSTTSFANLVIDNSSSSSTAMFVSSGGTLNVTTGSVTASSGRAVDLDDTHLGVQLGSVSSNGSGTFGIELANCSGSFTASGGTIVNSTNEAVRLWMGSANFSYGGSITNSSGRAVDVDATTGGDISFGGAITDTGALGIRSTGPAVGAGGALVAPGEPASARGAVGGWVRR